MELWAQNGTAIFSPIDEFISQLTVNGDFCTYFMSFGDKYSRLKVN